MPALDRWLLGAAILSLGISRWEAMGFKSGAAQAGAASSRGPAAAPTPSRPAGVLWLPLAVGPTHQIRCSYCSHLPQKTPKSTKKTEADAVTVTPKAATRPRRSACAPAGCVDGGIVRWQLASSSCQLRQHAAAACSGQQPPSRPTGGLMCSLTPHCVQDCGGQDPRNRGADHHPAVHAGGC